VPQMGMWCSFSYAAQRKQALRYSHSSTEDIVSTIAANSIRTSANGYRGPFQLRHDLEIHAVDRGDQGWRHQHHRHHREQLDAVVCSRLTTPSMASSTKVILPAIGGMVGQRGHVAAAWS